MPEPITNEELRRENLDSAEQYSSEYRENVLFYIGGFIANKGYKSNICQTCIEALLDFSWNSPSLLTSLRDYGSCLLHPSEDMMKLLRISETLIRAGHDYHFIWRQVWERYGRLGKLFVKYLPHFEAEVDALSSHYYSLVFCC